MLRKALITLAIAVPAFADSSSDAVNERIPVSRAQLEAHWQVDCAAAWTRLSAELATPGLCEVSAGLRRQLELCSFIYQPPGGELEPVCPDYRGALEHLDAAGSVAGCHEMTSFLRSGGACSTASPN